MYILKSARIEGMWGRKQIQINFDHKVNFLIGVNGSGKTTVLNSIASALSSDYEGLARSPFATLECTLLSRKNNDEVQVAVRRAMDESSPRPSFSYRIQNASRETQYFELLGLPPRYIIPSIKRDLTKSRIFDGEESPVANLVNIKWITVHRTPSKLRHDDKVPTEPSVDRRLTTLSNQLVRYFSKLAALRELETNRFLRQVLSTLVYNASEFSPLSEQVEKLDLPALQSSLEDLLGTFQSTGLEKQRERLIEHFKMAANAQRADKRGETLRLSELMALATAIPMQRMVEEWKGTLEKQERIRRPQHDFLNVINEMYKNKILSLNQRNELEVVLDDGTHLPLSELSSGEKQLLILFSESLLQERREFIYIADEPELSLHITWQEQLTRNLLKINPNAQVIFATHSPDIVSQFGQNTIDMENATS